jgi:hypothetical protein
MKHSDSDRDPENDEKYVKENGKIVLRFLAFFVV